MKKVSRTENCAGFEALQSGMEQDEGSRILLPTWLLYGVYFLVIVVLLIAPKMKK